MILPKPVYKPAFAITRASHLVRACATWPPAAPSTSTCSASRQRREPPTTLWLRGLEEGCHHSLVLKTGEPACRAGRDARSDRGGPGPRAGAFRGRRVRDLVGRGRRTRGAPCGPPILPGRRWSSARPWRRARACSTTSRRIGRLRAAARPHAGGDAACPRMPRVLLRHGLPPVGIRRSARRRGVLGWSSSSARAIRTTSSSPRARAPAFTTAPTGAGDPTPDGRLPTCSSARADAGQVEFGPAQTLQSGPRPLPLPARPRWAPGRAVSEPLPDHRHRG